MYVLFKKSIFLNVIYKIELPAAEFSSTSAGFVSYPLDTVRRRMMIQSFTSQAGNTPKLVTYSVGIMEYIIFVECYDFY